jgi:hypothetical protein
LLHITNKEFTKSSLVLSLSLILVIGALLQILSASFFVDNDNLHIKIPKIYAEEDGGGGDDGGNGGGDDGGNGGGDDGGDGGGDDGGDGGGDDGNVDASDFITSNDETNDEDVSSNDDSGNDDSSGSEENKGPGNIISNFFGGSNEETNDKDKDSDNGESNVPNFFGIADDEETTNGEGNTNNEGNNIDNSNQKLPTTLTVENQGNRLITNPIQPDPTSGRCPDGYHRSPSGDCEKKTDTKGMERCPDGFHRSPDGDCERVSDYKVSKGKYYHYYYDDNDDDNDVKIIKKIYKRDNTCQTQSDSTQLKGELPPKNVIILADFDPCKLKDGRSTLSIPNNPYLKFVVLAIDKKGNNHKGAMIDLEKVQNTNKNNGLYLVNFESKMSGENPASGKKTTIKNINGLALYNLSEKPIQFNTGNSLALTAVLKK